MLSLVKALRTDTMRSLGFLTRFRVGTRWFAGFDGNYRRSARAFPIAATCAVLPAAVVLLAGDAAGLSPLLTALLAVAAFTLIGGGLHEDGLADTFDGLGGSDRERTLAIMRDSATGSYGVLALLVVTFARVLALAEIDPVGAALAWIAAVAGSRAVMVLLWSRSRPAREDGAAASAGRPTRKAARMAIVIGTILSLPAILWLGPFRALAALALLVAFAFLVRRVVMARIGGHTGDTLGAAALLGESAVLIGLATG